MSEEIVLSIFRGDAAGGQEVEYRVPLTPGMVVLDAVHQVQAHQAQDLAVRWNCKAAHCGSCGAEINGHPKLLCKTRLDILAEPGFGWFPGGRRPLSVRARGDQLRESP